MEKRTKRKPGQRINWDKVKIEYIFSDKSLNSVLEKNGITSGRFISDRTKGWIKERQEMRQKRLEKIKKDFICTGKVPKS